MILTHFWSRTGLSDFLKIKVPWSVYHKKLEDKYPKKEPSGKAEQQKTNALINKGKVSKHIVMMKN